MFVEHQQVKLVPIRSLPEDEQSTSKRKKGKRKEKKEGLLLAIWLFLCLCSFSSGNRIDVCLVPQQRKLDEVLHLHLFP